MWVIIVLLGTALIFGFTYALAKAAAPKNKRERMIDDYQQMKALGYFDSPEGRLTGEILFDEIQNITSGCPVENNK